MNIRIISQAKKIIFFSPALAFLILISFSSCVKDTTAANKADEQRKIDNYKIKAGFSDSDTIGTDGIYFKYITEADGATPKLNDYVIISLTGKTTEGNVFQTTDSATAKTAGFYRADIIWGPAKIMVINNLVGLSTVLMHMKEGSHATALVPSKLAYKDYDPVVYDVTLYRIIPGADIKKYEFDQAKSYAMADSILDTYPGTAHDYPALDSTFFRTINEGTTAFDLKQSDSVYITLHAYYAEADSTYINSNRPRRTFFPINNSGTTINYVFGESFFPLSPAIDSALLHMKIGGEIDMVVNSKYGYGSAGFAHPIVGAIIIPTYMSIHYRIRVDTLFANE